MQNVAIKKEGFMPSFCIVLGAIFFKELYSLTLCFM